jgi:hypothetical protein
MSTSTLQGGRASSALGSGEWVRTFLLVQSATFVLASMTHFGFLLPGYAHAQAGTAEGVIASILLGGLLATWIRPRLLRGIALGVQGFALAGTFVGLFTIVVGFGPRTTLDLVIHAAMIAELVVGLIVTARARTTSAGMPA